MTDQQESNKVLKEIGQPIATQTDAACNEKDKGKMIAVPPEGVDICDINPAIPNQILEIKLTEIMLEALTPPPASTEAAEKKTSVQRKETTTAKKQLFQLPEQDPNAPATKKPKTDEPSPDPQQPHPKTDA